MEKITGGTSMNNLLAILNILIMLALLAGLFMMQKKHVSFSKRVFTALGLGIIFGFALQWVYGPTHEVTMTTADWFSIVGSGYVKFLQMIVMPLVFVSIVAAFTRLKLTSNIGKISSLIIGILLVTTAIAAAIGIFTTTSFNLESVQITKGEAELQRGEDLENNLSSLEAKTIPQQVVELLPANPFLDLTGARSTSTIGGLLICVSAS